MKRSTGPILLTCLTVAAVFAGCSDDPPPANNPTGGSSGAGTTAGTDPGGSGGTPMAGSSTTGGTDAGSGGTTAGSAGTAGGGAGGTGGTTAGTAGTGGMPEPIIPTVVLIDNVRLQLKPGFTEGAGGSDGTGGAGGAPELGTGGAPELGTGGVPDVGTGGVPSEPGMGGEGGGDAGPVDDPPWPAGELGLHGFLHTFDANVMPFAFNTSGFSPGPGGSEGPAITNTTILAHSPDLGRPGGAVQLSVPFTVPKQQADIAGMFVMPADLTHYELVAEVKLVSAAYGADCTSAWMYVYGGNGYANDASGEPEQYTTGHLVEGVWKTVRLDLDGPYGFHTTPTFTPATIQIWGLQLNTWGCQ